MKRPRILYRRPSVAVRLPNKHNWERRAVLTTALVVCLWAGAIDPDLRTVLVVSMGQLIATYLRAEPDNIPKPKK